MNNKIIFIAVVVLLIALSGFTVYKVAEFENHFVGPGEINKQKEDEYIIVIYDQSERSRAFYKELITLEKESGINFYLVDYVEHYETFKDSGIQITQLPTYLFFQTEKLLDENGEETGEIVKEALFRMAPNDISHETTLSTINNIKENGLGVLYNDQNKMDEVSLIILEDDLAALKLFVEDIEDQLTAYDVTFLTNRAQKYNSTKTLTWMYAQSDYSRILSQDDVQLLQQWIESEDVLFVIDFETEYQRYLDLAIENEAVAITKYFQDNYATQTESTEEETTEDEGNTTE